MNNKDKILQIAFKYKGVDRITQLNIFKIGLVDQQKLIKSQIQSVNRIITHELKILKK